MTHNGRRCRPSRYMMLAPGNKNGDQAVAERVDRKSLREGQLPIGLVAARHELYIFPDASLPARSGS